MEGYFDFNILMHRLVAGFDYDVSLIKGPSRIIIPQSKKEGGAAEKPKPEEVKDYKEQFTFSQDDFAVTWSYRDDHKAMVQSLHVKKRDREGIEKIVCLEESDHLTKMFVKKGEQKFEEVPIDLFDTKDICAKMMEFLQY